jgi:hypothetical protein
VLIHYDVRPDLAEELFPNLWLTKTDRARIKAIREKSGVKAAMREVQRVWKNDEAAENGSVKKP